MHIKYGSNKSLIEMEKSILDKIEKAKSRAKSLYLGKCVKFPSGKFVDRWGKVNMIAFHSGHGLCAYITPFSIKGGQVGRLLNDSDESREGYKISQIKIVSDFVPNDKIVNYKKGVGDD